MAQLTEAENALLNKIDRRYRANLEDYLRAAKNNEDWLKTFPEEMQWLLRASPHDLVYEYALEMGLPFTPTRKELSPTFGNQFLELAQRRHTAVNALQTGELKWGSGWEQIEEEVSDVNRPTIKKTIDVYGRATGRLLVQLLTTPFDKDIVERDERMGQIVHNLKPLDIIIGLKEHEKSHLEMFRIVFDGVLSPFPSSYKKAVTTPLVK